MKYLLLVFLFTNNKKQKSIVGFEEPMKNPNTEETKPKTKLSDAFDEKGRFI